MAATIIDGKAIAAKMRGETQDKVNRLKERGITPCLAVIIAGDNLASLSYVKGKKKALAETGMEGRDYHFPETVSEDEILALIANLNADEKVHGILVQLPLPSHIRKSVILNSLKPEKDVDCFHPISLGKLFLGEPGFRPCTPHGIITMLAEHKIPASGAHAVVVGRSNIVGKPLASLLSMRRLNATVTVCHTGTRDLGFFTRSADILVAAAGSPGLIKGDMIKKGAAVIDVGINRVEDSGKKKGYRVTGDVVFDEACEVAGWITPVPGGVGPMTIATLLQNVVQAAGRTIG